jgi:hypothetical protein
MPKYETSIIGPQGGVVDTRHFACATDAEAIERARDFVPALGFDLHCGDRFVGREQSKATTFLRGSLPRAVPIAQRR